MSEKKSKDQPEAPKEVRYTDEKTGGQKGRKMEELGAIDPRALRILAEVAAIGAAKYSRINYMKGYPWSWSFDAMMRHALAFWDGEDIDPETGKPHIVHASWHALALCTFLVRGLGTDDRYSAFVCSCGVPGLTYEGPERDCQVHGENV